MAKKALIVSVLAGFIGTFLKHDIQTLQSMGNEVHCVPGMQVIKLQLKEKNFHEMGQYFTKLIFHLKRPCLKTR